MITVKVIPQPKITIGVTSDGAGTGNVISNPPVTANNIAVYDGATGRKIKDGGKSIADIEAQIPTKTSQLTNDSGFISGNFVDLTSNQSIAGVKTFQDEIVANVLEFKAQETNVGTPAVDNTFMFERKYIQNGYKIIELVSKDEADQITVLRTTKILL